MFTRGFRSSMITVTMVSGRVISFCGSAASRSRMFAYCTWSAIQNSAGSGDFTKGAQNCRKIVGRDPRHQMPNDAIVTRTARIRRTALVETHRCASDLAFSDSVALWAAVEGPFGDAEGAT